MSPRLTALLLASAVAWLAPATAGAQSAIISGIVRGADGEPINDATVVARTAPSDQRDRTTQTTTNESGRFGFIGLRAGTWIFTMQKLGFEPTETRATIRRTGRINVSVILEFDPFNPPAPVTGSLAGIRAVDIQVDLAAAHALFDQDDFDGAIDAYAEMLERVPQLTSLNLQIGHAYREKRDFERALAAYRAVPADSPAAREAAAAIEALQTENGASGR
ncbi:MAG: carboxypeptidase-like regulatory domain-containing protein [Vicinamibacterales bacterium]